MHNYISVFMESLFKANLFNGVSIFWKWLLIKYKPQLHVHQWYAHELLVQFKFCMSNKS